MYHESNVIELKEQLVDDVKKEIVAFLNTDGGIIYVGVKDDGTVVPFTNQKEKDSLDCKISNWISDAFFPIPSNLIKHYFNSDNVLVIEVLKGDEKPYYLKEKGPKPSGVYKRVGSTIRMANDSEILLMLLDSKKYSYEDDISEEQELTFKYFNEICDDNYLPHEERNMKSLRMINKDGLYTNLALLMSDQSPIVVKFAKYDSQLNFKVKKEYKGSLLKVMNNVLENAANYNDISAVIDGTSWQRKETISYPGASLRESILNAFCHSNYFIRSNIKIEFYDDKVKITNPGGIYQATLEQIFDGVQTYRNPGLVNILSKLHYIENFGTGIPRILEAYENSTKKVDFSVSDNFFIIKLPNLNYRDPVNDPANDPVNDSEKIIVNNALNDVDLSILRMIQLNPGLNAKQISEKLHLQYSRITLDVVKNSLKRKLVQYVEFRGSPKTGGYFVI